MNRSVQNTIELGENEKREIWKQTNTNRWKGGALRQRQRKKTFFKIESTFCRISYIYYR